ncbi:MAG: PAS domain S-box protein [Opitutales bacterium]|jgi:PAS domain S-box-containing protein
MSDSCRQGEDGKDEQSCFSLNALPVAAVFSPESRGGRFVLNDRFASLVGYGPEKDPDLWMDAVSPECRVALAALISDPAALPGGMDLRMGSPDKGWVSVHADASRTEAGTLVCFSGPRPVLEVPAVPLPGEGVDVFADNAPDLVTRHGHDGIILFASDASARVLGADAGSLVGHCLDEFVVDEDRPMFRDFILGLQAGGDASGITSRMQRRDGSLIWVETRAAAIRGKRGGVDITCVTRDVSERKLAEDKARALQSLLVSAIENMDAGVVLYDKDDKLVFSNNRYRFFYPDLGSLITPGTPYSAIMSAFIAHGAADDSGLTGEKLMEIRIREHKARTGRVRQQRIPGNIWLNVSDHPTQDGGVVSLLTDITALKKTQDELSRQRILLTSLLDSIPDMIWYKDGSGVYLACNPAFCKFVGMAKERIVGHTDEELFRPDVASQVVTGDRSAIENGCVTRMEYLVPPRDASIVLLDVVRAPLYSADAGLIGLVGIARDMTDRHNTEAKLKAESLRLATLIRSLDGGVLVMDQQMRVILANEGFMSLFGMEGEPTGIVGSDCDTLMPRAIGTFADPQEPCRLFKRIFADGKPIRDGLLNLSDRVFIEYDFIPIDIGPETLNYLWHFRDVTSRRLAELELAQRDTLLSGLAQTVRHLLAGLEDFEESITESFRIVAEAACIERIIIFQNHRDEHAQGDIWTSTLRFRWSRYAEELEDIVDMPFEPDFSRWFRELSRGVILAGSLSEFLPCERKLLEKYGVGSLLVAPMFIESKFWGIMLFDARPNREWSSSDRSILRMVADSVGLAIQRKHAHDQLNSALAGAEIMAEEASKATQAKTDFLASMSHEIRTPLNGVVGYSNLLRNTQLTSRQSELLHGIDRSTGMLLALINDILDLSKITAGQLTLDCLAFCPALAAQDAIAALSPKAAEKGIAISCDADPLSRQVFMGDERRLKQVMLNLVGNAIKFTESGSVRVGVSATELPSDSRVRLDFSVKDTGIGISCENQTKLFRPFSQAENDISRRFGGTGLGLAICKQLVDLMGGQIGVDSISGRGSTFWFHIFCNFASEDSAPVAQERPGGIGQDMGRDMPLHIVIADDNVINQEVMSLYIQELGYDPLVVSDGAEALHAVMDRQVDLVFMDIRMPGMDGMESTKAIREWERDFMPAGRWPVRIVALTADAVKSDTVRCLSLGMDDYLTKPVDPDQIELVIHNLFGEQGGSMFPFGTRPQTPDA